MTLEKPILTEITKITGIRNENLIGKIINWEFVLQALKESHLIVCHYAQFDRNFLELQTPEEIQKQVISLPFGCTIKILIGNSGIMKAQNLIILTGSWDIFMMVIEQLTSARLP
ncbi:hypothetical protein [Legionella cincinnatiensis]|uniref:Exonuclease n=1 Tax=Legionella cincinnatiensis TaxID=28085 RepID=A0A378IEW5_9GAMM|nr:hypothetical protein [Legionella cincinnatiensis]KTC92170.1 putative exonuclease [Legionella cincinnatiensis]STX33526.1 putative exonuclease [Legionella cincinnatiensis]